MYVIRNCFIAKPGNASKLAAQLKEAAASAKVVSNHRVLTDVTGEFNRVILEYEVESIGDLEASMKDYETNSAFREKMKGYTDLFLSGSREMLQVV